MINKKLAFSMTFQDLDKIPGLSRPWKMCLSNSMTFHDFPGPVATLGSSSSSMINRPLSRITTMVCAMLGEGGKVELSSLSGISKSAPLGVAYCLTEPKLALIQQRLALIPNRSAVSARPPDQHFCRVGQKT